MPTILQCHLYINSIKKQEKVANARTIEQLRGKEYVTVIFQDNQKDKNSQNLNYLLCTFYETRHE